MFKLSDDQLMHLDRLEKAQYVNEVRKTLVTEHPELSLDDGLKARLEAAYWHAVSLGFTDGAAITQFLYYDAFAPGFYREPAIDNWLRRLGKPVEQRFSDLIEVVKAKARGH